jgi:hypothetical protein
MAHNPLSSWFANLLEIHDHMQTLNLLTDPDLKKFAAQSPATLLPSDLLKRNLSQFCFTQFGQHVPDTAFSVTTFSDLNDVLSPTLHLITRAVLMGAAIEHDQKYSAMTQTALGKQLSAAVFDTAAVRGKLFDTLDGLLPTSFFPTDGTASQAFDQLLTTANRTIDQAIDAIYA